MYEGLSWVSSVVASVIDMYIQTASHKMPTQDVEIGLRKERLSIQDCENPEKGLEKAFGFGAKVVELRILKILHSKLGVNKKIEAGFIFRDEVRMTMELHDSKLHSHDTR